MMRRVTMLQDMRRRWPAYGLVGVIWALAMLRVFADHTPRLPVLFNNTPSLPYKVALVRYGVKQFVRGDYIVYAFDGSAQQYFPGLKGQPFFKVIRGVAGDRVDVRGREVFVNGASVGMAMPYALKRVTLLPIAPSVIPPGYFYVQGTSVDSFDSRYSISGLVRADQIVAAVQPLF